MDRLRVGLIALAALCGCGRSGLDLTDRATGGPSSSSSGATPQDASSADGGDLDAGSSEPPPSGPTNTGTIVFVNCCGEYAQASVIAWFYLGMPNAGCETTQTAGACVYYQSCPDGPFSLPFSLPFSTIVPPNTVSAGALTVVGGELDAGLLLTLADGGTYGYQMTTASGPETFFLPGDTLTVSASGGVVPAFMAPPLAVPQAGTLVFPQPNASGSYPVSTTKDLAVQWSGGEPGARFFLQGEGSQNTFFFCAWDATVGQGVVPQSMLAPLKGRGLNGSLLWYQQRTATITAGAFAIQESVLQYGSVQQVAYY